MNIQPSGHNHEDDANRPRWDAVASGWNKWSETQLGALQPLSDRMVELAAIGPGHRVLDIATGIGEPAVTAARRVGPSGHVLATDLSTGMLSFGRERAARLGLGNIEFREMDAEAIDLPQRSFDAILCRFGLMFLENLEADLATIRGLLVPGGRFVAAVWGPADKVPTANLPRKVAMQELALSSLPAGTPDPSSLADADDLARTFERAGFVDVETEQMDAVYEWPSAVSFTDFVKDISAVVKGLLADQPAERQAQVWDAIEAAARQYEQTDTSIRMVSEVHLIVGRSG